MEDDFFSANSSQSFTILGAKYSRMSIQKYPSKICGRQTLKNLKADHIISNFLKVVFHKFYLVRS